MSRILILLIAIGLSLAGCSEKRSDPIAIGSGDGPGASRANLVVDHSNRYAALQGIFEDIRDLFNNSIGMITNLDAGQSARVLGNHNGYALVSELDPDTTGTSIAVAPDVKLDFVNYFSETGKLFYIGGLELIGEWRNTGGVQQLYKFILNGTINITGDYACQITFENFHMALASNGLVLNMQQAIDIVERDGPSYSIVNQGLVIIYSGAITVRFSPYLFDYGPD